jgi:PKD domain-containing protein
MRSMKWIPAAGMVLFAACGGGGSDIQSPSGNTPPTANFGVSCAGLTCTFSDSSSDAHSSIKAWQWNFGDGATGMEQNPVHAYASAGSYNATLTVTDSAGASDSITKPVQPQAPTADLTCTNATTAGGPSTCSFTLPEAARVRAVLTDTVPCGAHGDVFAFTAPVADTLTSDGCFAPAGTQVELPSSPAGTQVSFNIVGGLTQYMTAVQASGQYPEWTLKVEDAVGAPWPVDFADMDVTLTVLPGP